MLQMAIFCTYCKKPGHTINKCRNLNCKASQSSTLFIPPKQSLRHKKPVATANVVNTPQQLFQPYMFECKVSLLGSENKVVPINILRDTGAAQTIMSKDVISNITTAYTGEKVILSDLSSHPSYPLAKVYIQCPLVSGEVQVAIKSDELPVPGVQLLLGNDLAGSLVVPNLTVVESPLETSPTEALDTATPHLFPSCAVTRSQSKNKDFSVHPPTVLPSEDLYSSVIIKDNLITAQEQDDTLCKIRHAVNEGKDLSKLPCFYYQEGVLMRAYRPPELQELDTWSETHQVVIPTSVRPPIIEMAHDGVSGHLGIHKTYKKILQHFFWPGMKQDMTKFIKTCHICQLIGKPNECISPAPLKDIPVQTEPFEKIVIDCVGPLPRTKKGKQYILTIMDTATRYPEACPLKNISSKSIIKCLLHFFTAVGIPKVIQSDQGSNFTSNFFQQIVNELNITHLTSSAYHPQSQGCLERCHQIFKAMFKKFTLLFHLTPGNALSSKFCGPYIVAQKLTPLNYIVHTPDRRKDTQLVHVNLMKSYLSREPEEDSQTPVPVTNVYAVRKESGTLPPEEDSDLEFDISAPKGRRSNSQILLNLDEYFSCLPSSQRSDLKQLLRSFQKSNS